MFKRLFARTSDARQALCDAVYGQIVAAARQPRFYAEWGVPDTPLGRFEMLALHMILVLRRLSGGGAAAEALAADLTDLFFAETDRALRDLGVGDTRVPRRLKELASMFYGRARAYGDALGAGDQAALAEALARNVWQGNADGFGAVPLAAEALAAAARLAGTSIETILAGRLGLADLPPPEAAS